MRLKTMAIGSGFLVGLFAIVQGMSSARDDHYENLGSNTLKFGNKAHEDLPHRTLITENFSNLPYGIHIVEVPSTDTENKDPNYYMIYTHQQDGINFNGQFGMTKIPQEYLPQRPAEADMNGVKVWHITRYKSAVLEDGLHNIEVPGTLLNGKPLTLEIMKAGNNHFGMDAVFEPQ